MEDDDHVFDDGDDEYTKPNLLMIKPIGGRYVIHIIIIFITQFGYI